MGTTISWCNGAHSKVCDGNRKSANCELRCISERPMESLLTAVVLSTHPLVHRLIPSHPLMVLATMERFLPTRGTFRAILANESHWLQPVLVLSIHWWPPLVGVGRILVCQINKGMVFVTCHLAPSLDVTPLYVPPSDVTMSFM